MNKLYILLLCVSTVISISSNDGSYAQDIKCKMDKFSFRDIAPTGSAPMSRVKIESSGFMYSTDIDGAAYEASISSTTGQPDIFAPNSEQVLIGGPIAIGKNKVLTDRAFPALFKLIKGRGLVYLSGRAIVISSNGSRKNLGEKGTLENFLKCIGSKDMLDREAAAWALGWLTKTQEHREKTIPALVNALSDPSFEVRLISAESLGRIGDASALPALKQAKMSEKDKWVIEVIDESIITIEKKKN